MRFDVFRSLSYALCAEVLLNPLISLSFLPRRYLLCHPPPPKLGLARAPMPPRIFYKILKQPYLRPYPFCFWAWGGAFFS